MGDGEDGTAKNVEQGPSRCRGMDGRLLSRVLFRGLLCGGRTEGSVDAQGVPRLPGAWLGFEIFAHETLDVGVGSWVEQNRVVDIPGRLQPGVEDDLVIRVVGVERGDDAFDRIVKQDRADAHLVAEDETVRRREERFVLTDRLPLVVEDGPAAAHPARVDVLAGTFHRSRLGLNDFLDFAAEAVGVAEAELDSQRLH